jgi:hypothetical protein
MIRAKTDWSTQVIQQLIIAYGVTNRGLGYLERPIGVISIILCEQHRRQEQRCDHQCHQFCTHGFQCISKRKGGHQPALNKGVGQTLGGYDIGQTDARYFQLTA